MKLKEKIKPGKKSFFFTESLTLKIIIYFSKISAYCMVYQIFNQNYFRFDCLLVGIHVV